MDKRVKNLNKFEKVKSSTFLKGMVDCFYNNNFIDLSNNEATIVREQYDEIKTPKRATKYSAGYDFFAPFGFVLKPGETITIPTGIKCNLDEDKFLAIVPRSGLGFKYKLRLTNTLGVVDADYFNNEANEGHIFVKISNENNENKELKVNKGEAFAQGIILSYFTTADDKVTKERKGGFGSTTKV